MLHNGPTSYTTRMYKELDKNGDSKCEKITALVGGKEFN
jgi:hypothetical protein